MVYLLPGSQHLNVRKDCNNLYYSLLIAAIQPSL